MWRVLPRLNFLKGPDFISAESHCLPDVLRQPDTLCQLSD
jgi:hypothetical protein